MAAINNSINLTDRMSPVLKSIMKALDSTLKVLDQLDRATNKGMNSDAFRLAQHDIEAANEALGSMNGDLDSTNQKLDSMNNTLTTTKKRLNLLHAAGSMFSALGDSATKFISSLDHGLNILERISDKIGDVLTTADRARSQVARIGLYNKSAYSNEQVYGQVFSTAMATRSGLFETGDLVNKLLMSGVFTGNTATTSALNMAGIINKALIAGGGIAEDNERALRQLNQALSSGILQGDELKSIREQAPYLAQVLAKGLGKIDDKFIDTAIGDLKELGSEGELTSDRVVKAFWAMQSEIDEDFKKMPKTFGQAMTSLSNIWNYFLYLISGTDGPLGKINEKLWQLIEYLQSAEGIELMNDLATGINIVVTVIGDALDKAGEFIRFLKNNTPVAEALFISLGVAAAAAGISAALSWILATWPILLLMAVVYAISSAFLDAGASSEETAGTIAGNVAYAAGIIWNALMVILDTILWVAAILGIIVVAVVGGIIIVIMSIIQAVIWVVMAIITLVWAIKVNIEAAVLNAKAWFVRGCNDALRTFEKFTIGVLDLLGRVAEAMDRVFGLHLSEAVAEGTEKLKKKITTYVDEYVEEHNPDKYTEEADRKMKAFRSGVHNMWTGDEYNLYDELHGVADGASTMIRGIWDGALYGNEALTDAFLDQDDLDDMRNAGYNWGSGLVSGVKGIIDGLPDESVLEGLGSGIEVSGGNLDSVGSIKNDVNINDEDIQLLRDMAARDYLLNLQQITPVAHISFGDVRETADVNKIMDVIEDMVEEQMATSLVSN